MKALSLIALGLAATSAWGAELSSPPPATSTAPTASAASADIKLPVPEVETLPNGLKLAWFVNDHLPLIDMGLLVRSGYRDDPSGKSGVAELLSSVLDRGNAGMNAQQIGKAIEDLGASRYISDDDDTFSVGVHGLAPDAPVLLDLMAKIALQPEFPEAEVSREQARVLDRWNHLTDYGESLAGVAYSRIIAANTSYERGGFASAAEFRNVTRADVMNYYKKNFTPKNSILMIVGRVNKAVFREKVIAAFGKWQGEAPRHEYRDYQDARLRKQLGKDFFTGKERIIVVDRPELTQAQVRIGFRAPLLQAPDHYALVVGNALTGEYFNSRLNSLIRDKLGLTYSISSEFAYSKDFATFNVVSATRNESVGQLIRRTLDVLAGLKAGPIPQDEIHMAKEYLIGGFPLSTSTLGAVASRWLAGTIFDLGPDYLNEFVPKVRAIQVADVVQAMGKDMDLKHAVIVVAGDAKQIIKSLKDADFWTWKRVSAADLM